MAELANLVKPYVVDIPRSTFQFELNIHGLEWGILEENEERFEERRKRWARLLGSFGGVHGGVHQIPDAPDSLGGAPGHCRGHVEGFADSHEVVMGKM